MSASDAQAINIKVGFGAGNYRTYNVSPGTTIRSIITDPKTVTALDYPPNVRALIDRVEQSLDDVVSSGDVIMLETVGTKKG